MRTDEMLKVEELAAENTRLTVLNRSLLDDNQGLRTLVERLRANQERMWCSSCGTVTRSQECDCTSCGTPELQKFVNYADSRQGDIDALAAEIERLRAAAINLMAAIDNMHQRGETFTPRVSIAASDMRQALEQNADGRK
jgi:hypothetical protein